jgi:hypothetical protein
MASLNTVSIIADMGPLLSTIKANIMDEIGFTFEQFIGFGLQNSHMYRTKLLAIFTKESLNEEAINYVLFFAMLIKNRERILKVLKSADFVAKFAGNPSMKAATDFYEFNTVQYVTEVDDTPGNKGKMPVVNIPTCMPNVMTHLWLSYNKTNPQWKNYSPDAKVNLFLDLQWAGQMNLSADLKDKAKVRNEEFWTKKVTKSKNRNRDPTTALKFHPEFWANQAADMYPFMIVKGDGTKEFSPTLYGDSELKTYLSS